MEAPCLCPKCGIELQAVAGTRCPLCGTPLQSKADLGAAKAKAEVLPRLDPAFAPTNPRVTTDEDAAKTLPGVPSPAPADDAKTNPQARVPDDPEAAATQPGGWETGAAPGGTSVSPPSAPFRAMPSLVPPTTLLPPPPFVGQVPKPAPPPPGPVLFRGGGSAPPVPGTDVTTVSPDAALPPQKPKPLRDDDDDAVPASSLEVVEETPAPIPASELEAKRWPQPTAGPTSAPPPPPPAAWRPTSSSAASPIAGTPRPSLAPAPSPVAPVVAAKGKTGPNRTAKLEERVVTERSATRRSSGAGWLVLTILVLAAIAGAFYAGRRTAHITGLPQVRIPN